MLDLSVHHRTHLEKPSQVHYAQLPHSPPMVSSPTELSFTKPAFPSPPLTQRECVHHAILHGQSPVVLPPHIQQMHEETQLSPPQDLALTSPRLAGTPASSSTYSSPAISGHFSAASPRLRKSTLGSNPATRLPTALASYLSEKGRPASDHRLAYANRVSQDQMAQSPGLLLATSLSAYLDSGRSEVALGTSEASYIPASPPPSQAASARSSNRATLHENTSLSTEEVAKEQDDDVPFLTMTDLYCARGHSVETARSHAPYSVPYYATTVDDGTEVDFGARGRSTTAEQPYYHTVQSPSCVEVPMEHHPLQASVRRQPKAPQRHQSRHSKPREASKEEKENRNSSNQVGESTMSSLLQGFARLSSSDLETPDSDLKPARPVDAPLPPRRRTIDIATGSAAAATATAPDARKKVIKASSFTHMTPPSAPLVPPKIITPPDLSEAETAPPAEETPKEQKKLHIPTTRMSAEKRRSLQIYTSMLEDAFRPHTLHAPGSLGTVDRSLYMTSVLVSSSANHVANRLWSPTSMPDDSYFKKGDAGSTSTATTYATSLGGGLRHSTISLADLPPALCSASNASSINSSGSSSAAPPSSQSSFPMADAIRQSARHRPSFSVSGQTATVSSRSSLCESLYNFSNDAQFLTGKAQLPADILTVAPHPLPDSVRLKYPDPTEVPFCNGTFVNSAMDPSLDATVPEQTSREASDAVPSTQKNEAGKEEDASPEKETDEEMPSDRPLNEEEEESSHQCPICLHPFHDKALLKGCYHAFCFLCVLQWGEVARLCPLCKSPFDTILHHLQHDTFDQFLLPAISETVAHSAEAGETRVVHAPLPRARPPHRRRPHGVSSVHHDVERQVEAANAFRRAVYRYGFRVKHVGANYLSKFREIDPARFQRLPRELDRLVPWIRRDLHVFMDPPEAELVLRVVQSLLIKFHPQSSAFIQEVTPFLHEKAEHFAQELAAFARSPYEMRQYDANVVYDRPT